MDIEKTYSDLKKKIPNLEIYLNHSLSQYTTIKIGGPADIFIHTHSSNEFLTVLKNINENENPITILGNGSNVLISDYGIRGIVIKNDSDEIEILNENKIKTSSGTQLSSLISYSLNHNLLGLEQFAYIPSTVGGAIAGNIHGIRGHFSEYVDSIEKYKDIVLFVILKLTPGDSTIAKTEVQEIIQKKTGIQSMNSLGSVFKNPENHHPAGMIIDQDLNLKGYAIGDAQISSDHANFIINKGHATAKDYLALINLIQSQMQTKFGFKFELEIKLLGNFKNKKGDRLYAKMHSDNGRPC